MVPTTLYLPDDLKELVRVESEAAEVKAAELVRTAVWWYVNLRPVHRSALDELLEAHPCKTGEQIILDLILKEKSERAIARMRAHNNGDVIQRLFQR